MLEYGLRRVALHLDPRRPQRDPRDFHHGLLGPASLLIRDRPPLRKFFVNSAPGKHQDFCTRLPTAVSWSTRLGSCAWLLCRPGFPAQASGGPHAIYGVDRSRHRSVQGCSWPPPSVHREATSQHQPATTTQEAESLLPVVGATGDARYGTARVDRGAL